MTTSTNPAPTTNNKDNKNSAKRRVTVFLHHTVTKQARAQAIIEDITLTKIVEKALLAYLPKETVLKAVIPPRGYSLK